MGVARFHSPIIVKGNAHLDMTQFYSIVFNGGIVDVLHPPSRALDYDYALRILQFCALRANCGFDIVLWGKHTDEKFSGCSPMYVSFVDNYVDYANDELSSRNVICLDSLGDRISDLLMLYINNDMRPEFRFLPRRNDEAKRYYHSNIVDLYATLETEYRLMKKQNLLTISEASQKNDNAEELCEATRLKDAIRKLISDFDVSDNVKNKARSIIGNMDKLKQTATSPDFCSKIMQLLCCFGSNVFSNTQSYRLGELFGVVPAFLDFELERKIVQFAEMRNAVAHSKVTWNESVKMIPHLQILAYMCVLRRAGYTVYECKKIVGLPNDDRVNTQIT